MRIFRDSDLFLFGAGGSGFCAGGFVYIVSKRKQNNHSIAHYFLKNPPLPPRYNVYCKSIGNSQNEIVLILCWRWAKMPWFCAPCPGSFPLIFKLKILRPMIQNIYVIDRKDTLHILGGWHISDEK